MHPLLYQLEQDLARVEHDCILKRRLKEQIKEIKNIENRFTESAESSADDSLSATSKSETP